jgi:regulator of protease activity HflC (stomatin/prohibitin superfamily)
MLSELGKLTLDKTFEERDAELRDCGDNNQALLGCGIQCMCYEINDILPPANVKKAIELQAEAELQKRADVLTSEWKNRLTSTRLKEQGSRYPQS